MQNPCWHSPLRSRKFSGTICHQTQNFLESNYFSKPNRSRKFSGTIGHQTQYFLESNYFSKQKCSRKFSGTIGHPFMTFQTLHNWFTNFFYSFLKFIFFKSQNPLILHSYILCAYSMLLPKRLGLNLPRTRLQRRLMIVLMRSTQAEAVPRFSTLSRNSVGWPPQLQYNEAVMIINEIHIDTHRKYAPM
jgi:hypothetical protein